MANLVASATSLILEEERQELFYCPANNHSTAPANNHSTAPANNHSTAPANNHSTAPVINVDDTD
ncbi:1064_t:CDS:2 [Dentiscutata erythropus]|uniref:1064_t:CDS:1 n=1 Tax=Dentiscutata erythropus TaxID=1348616 RepID=A0A9N9FJJ9_9GLOM|nr:1064_t:CDS:2 [Dentiscutata erythropus]